MNQLHFPETLASAIEEIVRLRADCQMRERALAAACAAMDKMATDLAPLVEIGDVFGDMLNAMKRDSDRYRALRTQEFARVPLQGDHLDSIVDEFIETQSNAKELDL